MEPLRKRFHERERERERELADRFYAEWKPFQFLAFSLRQFASEKTSARRQAILNRLKDYVGIKEQLALHYDVAKILERQRQNYESYDYGEGYFYQSCKPLHITGFRSTETRIKDMDLRNLLKGKRVLDIGTNAGFIPLECADVCQSIDAFDINPFLIEIAQTCAKFLHLDNIRFWSGTFEEYNEAKTYDVVLSFANHSTYDHNTKQSLDDYFRKCRRYVINGGMLLFESHLPSYETPGQLNKVLEVLGKYFNIEKTCKLNRKTAGDRGRMFAVCRKTLK